MIEEQKRYKAAGYAIFAVAIGLLLCRIIAYFLSGAFAASSMSEVAQEFWLDTVFTLLVQAGFCLGVPLLIYMRCQNKSVKQVFTQSNFKKTKWWIPLLCIPLGIAVYFCTIGISALWSFILILLGYQYPSSYSAFPASFNFGLFLVSLILSAVFPAVCEEFAIRGTFLTTMRHTFSSSAVLMVMALSFGLFHQNVAQVFYTALFGGFAAFLVIKTGSIIPAVVIHFVNNAMSVFLDYADNYGWGNGFSDKMYSAITNYGLFSIIVLILIAGGALVLLTLPIVKHSKKNRTEMSVMSLYKPTLRESAFYIGAICAASLTTVITFAFNS